MPKVRKKKLIMFLITLTSILSVLFFLSSGEDLNFVDIQNEELLSELKQIPRPFIRPDIIEEPYTGNFNRKSKKLQSLKNEHNVSIILFKKG